ncbi:MAG TPA: hypothetical protein VFB81_12885 [Myxococcales bacterium]|nr:hypothetical protein [Myxococcales bacterium]
MATRFAARLAALLLFCSPTLALAQAPSLSGTFSVVNNGPGEQTDPHVDCDLAPYTNDDNQGSQTIRYYNFATSTDHEIPGNGSDSLSDVSGTQIAFTESSVAGPRVIIFSATTQTRTALPGSNLSHPALGGNMVAYEDRSFSPSPNESEIVVFDQGNNSSVRLTNDSLFDKNPAMSPGGNVVIWEKCQTTGLGCDIYTAVRTGPGTWSTHLLSGVGEDRGPDTNGTLAVYVSNKSGENDVYYQPVVGGAETHLAIPGDQRDVSISGNLIAFESNGGSSQYDIYVFDIAASTLFRVTNTPVNETLNDVSICGGTGRIVFAAPGMDFDVFAFTFTPPPPPPPPANCVPAAEACEDPTGRTLLASMSVTRTTGAPNSVSTGLASAQQGVLLCVDNQRATSGEVSINNQRVVGPGAFKHQVDLVALRVDGLLPSNTLEASIAGQAGTSFAVRVYTDDPACHASATGRPPQEGGGGPHRPLRGGGVTPDPQPVSGERLTFLGRWMRLQYDVNEPLEADAMGGCAATSGLFISALAILVLWLTRRRPAPARVRRM